MNKTSTLSGSGLEQYSKDTLISLIKLYSRLYVALDGFWYLSLKEKLGNETALQHNTLVWEKMRKREFYGLMETLEVSKRDLRSFFQVFSLTPFFQRIEHRVEFKNDTQAILTATHCPTLFALEKEGEGREKDICGAEENCFNEFAKLFSPNLKASPIHIPPREKKEGHCCQWLWELMK